MKTILVVDDEPKIVQLVRDYLESSGFGVLVARDGKSALSTARTQKPDLIVLDLGLPGLDGLDVTRELRKTHNIPIIMLTARGEESDKLVGLELGADDYITKPFSPKELVARVRALFRRVESHAAASTQPIHAADLTLDAGRMRLNVLHGVAFESYERAIDAHIKNIRRKLGGTTSQTAYILTVYGVGYKFTED